MFVCFYMLINVTNIAMRLNVFCYIMLKVFAINNFIYLFYLKMSLL